MALSSTVQELQTGKELLDGEHGREVRALTSQLDELREAQLQARPLAVQPRAWHQLEAPCLHSLMLMAALCGL